MGARRTDSDRPMAVSAVWMRGGGVPGGHLVLSDGKRKPFIPPMKECRSIPLRHSDVVADIGAYVGTYAIQCARFPVRLVMAYEPTPRTFKVLNRTRLPNLESHQAAVVGPDHEGDTVSLYVSFGIGVTNSTASSRRAFKVSVPAIRYADAVHGASIIKVDVEGGEYDYGPLATPDARAMIVDFHPMPHWVERARAIVAQLESEGFEPVIRPKFDGAGWERSGSWVRPLEGEGEFSPMMSGSVCCGCGAEIAGRVKSLCPACWELWTPRERRTFEKAGLR